MPQSFAAPDVLLASYGYAAQIYCDFSGYTDIAIGLALLMGFVFPQNFDRPYRSLGFREFWRRWHMTLSRFLRDFLYIPLGGNRSGRFRTYRNLMITMVLGGLWHGAAWTFVLWGAFHGAGLCAEHVLGERWTKRPVWLRWVVTFHLIVFGWILFRAQGLGAVGDYLTSLFSSGLADAVDRARRGCGPAGDRHAAAAAAAARRVAAAARARQPGRAGHRSRRGDPARGGHRAVAGRAPVHLLPLLDWNEPPCRHFGLFRSPRTRAHGD